LVKLIDISARTKEINWSSELMRLKNQEQDEKFNLLEYNVSEEHFAFIFRVEESEDGGEMFLRNIY
jgi:hypothetical protein